MSFGTIILTILGIRIAISLMKIIVRAVKSADSSNSKGLVHLNASEYEKALVEFKKAYKEESNSNQEKVMNLRNISLAYQGLGEDESAYYYLKEAEKYCLENSYNDHIIKGEICLIKGNIDQAIEHFHTAEKIDRNKLEVNNSLGLIYLGDYGEAYIDLEKAIFYSKKANEIFDYAPTQTILAMAYFDNEEYEKAEKILLKTLKKTPNDLNSKLALGICKYYQKDNEQAKKIIAEVLQKDASFASGISEIMEDLGM